MLFLEKNSNDMFWVRFYNICQLYIWSDMDLNFLWQSKKCVFINPMRWVMGWGGRCQEFLGWAGEVTLPCCDCSALKELVEKMFLGHCNNSAFFWWDKLGGKKKKWVTKSLINFFFLSCFWLPSHEFLLRCFVVVFSDIVLLQILSSLLI